MHYQVGTEAHTHGRKVFNEVVAACASCVTQQRVGVGMVSQRDQCNRHPGIPYNTWPFHQHTHRALLLLLVA